MKWLVSSLCLTLCNLGCSSGPQRIAHSATVIRENANSSLVRFQDYGDSSGISEQQTILQQVDTITHALPTIQAVKPYWLNTVEWIAIAAVLVACLILVWSLGLGQLVRTAIGWIPRSKRTTAKLLKEAVDSESETDIREAVAALRALDREIDAAYRSS
jgi:hypothetical protein